jgi:hypothetical protein
MVLKTLFRKPVKVKLNEYRRIFALRVKSKVRCEVSIWVHLKSGQIVHLILDDTTPQDNIMWYPAVYNGLQSGIVNYLRISYPDYFDEMTVKNTLMSKPQ